MKRFIVIVAAVVTVPFVVGAGRRQATGTEAAVKQEILRIENERNRAVVSGDAQTLDRLTAADYTFVTLRGELRTKEDVVKGFTSGSFHYDARTISDLSVRVYGKVSPAREVHHVLAHAIR